MNLCSKFHAQSRFANQLAPERNHNGPKREGADGAAACHEVTKVAIGNV